MTRRAILLLAAAAVPLACSDAHLDPLPFQVSVAANSTSPALGDTVQFTVTTQGGQLVRVETDYGDNSGDAFNTAGARTARVLFRHPYAARGTFTMRATVTDAVAGLKDATIDIRVQ